MPRNLRIARMLQILLLVAIGALAGCQDESTSEHDARPVSRVVTVEITGMSCAKGCAPRAREALETLPWATNVQVDFERKHATFTAETAKIDEAAIKKVLEEAGFEGRVNK